MNMNCNTGVEEIKFKLYWTTLEGQTWLNKEFTIGWDTSNDDIYKMVKEYINQTHNQAKALVSGWRDNVGEWVSLIPMVDCHNTTFVTRILRFLEDIEDEIGLS
jgi:hypothetical protein